MFEIIHDLEIVSPNKKEHWAKNYARNKQNTNILVKYFMLKEEIPRPPCSVILERLYTARMKPFDDDNLISAFKGLKDSIADILIPGLAPGQADNPKHGITWQYSQSRDTKKAIRITIIEKSEMAVM